MNTTAEQIKRGMALAFFASAYVDMAEECGQALSGEIMDQLPDDIDPAALHAAETLTADLVRANHTGNVNNTALHGTALEWMLCRVERITEEHGSGDREVIPENLGHYLAMQAMGHGVGLIDAFGKEVYEAIRVPYIEFGSHSLQKDYFTSEADL